MIRSTIFAAGLAIPVMIWKICMGMQGLEPSLRNIVVLLILAPITEELIFRGLLQEILMRKSIALPILFTSLIFTLAHVLTGFLQGETVVYNLLVFIPSIVISEHYAKYRNVAAAAIIHAFYNVVAFIA